jgi:hypothetical protein
MLALPKVDLTSSILLTLRSLAFDLQAEAPLIPPQYLDRSSELGYLTSH